MQPNYLDSFRDKSDELLVATVVLWQNVFANDNYAAVSAAVMTHISTDTGRFMPPVGVIKSALVQFCAPEALPESEA